MGAALGRHAPRMIRGALEVALAAGLTLAACPTPASAVDLGPHPGRTGAVLLGRVETPPEEVRAAVEARGFFDGEVLGAADCAECHPDAVAALAGSAHRFASFANPYYAAAVLAFREERGPEAARFCADCHDPLVVAEGELERPGPFDPTTVSAQAGLTCLVCHSAHGVPDPRGNGGLALDGTPVPLKPGKAHSVRLRPSVLATPEFCGACHKVGLTETVTGDAWLRGQNEADAYRDSAWAGRGVAAIFRPQGTRRCQDCHMPREPALKGDKGARDGTLASHRFMAANTALASLRGDAEQLKRTQAFLKGAVAMALATSRAGTLDVVLRNVGAGHAFPGGTSDSNEAWLQVLARDATGRLIAQSGVPGEGGALPVETHLFRAQPVDGRGAPLRRRDVQHARGVVFDTSLPPGDPRVVQFALPAATARVEVRLLYRKFSPDYARFACAGLPARELRTRCERVPVTEVAAARADVADGAVSPPPEDGVLLQQALGLLEGLADEEAGDAYPARTLKRLAEGGGPPEIADRARLGLARLDVRAGRWGGPALDADAPTPLLWSRALAAHRAHQDAEALPLARRLAARLPDDRTTLALLSRLENITGAHADALRTADRLLLVDPEHEDALLQRLLALRARDAAAGAQTDGPPSEAVAAAEAAWLRHRRPVDRETRLRSTSRIWQRESIPVHVHPMEPAR